MIRCKRGEREIERERGLGPLGPDTMHALSRNQKKEAVTVGEGRGTAFLLSKYRVPQNALFPSEILRHIAANQQRFHSILGTQEMPLLGTL